MRLGEREARDALDDLMSSASSNVVRPRPLTARGCARVLHSRWRHADDAFCDACHQASGGNPFLLGELVADLAHERIEPRAENAARVRDIGPESVSQAMVSRLERLTPPAASVARAVAVLSAGADLAAVAGLTDLPESEVERARDGLTRAGILAEQRKLDFVHPIVRRAIYSSIPPSDRALLHSKAARLLEHAAGSLEEIAAHLLVAEPEGAAWRVAALRGAAARASERGAPDAAVAYLRRALAEPPAGPERAWVLTELGNAELRAGALVGGDVGWEGESPAVEHLREAVELIEDPRQRAEAALLLGDAPWARDRFREAADAFDAAVQDVRERDRELELRLEGHVAAAARLTLSAWPLAAGRLDRFLEVEGATPAERLVAGVLAVDKALSGERPEVAAELAERAVAGGRLPSDRAGAHTAVFAANALLWTDRLDRADQLLEQLETEGSDARLCPLARDRLVLEVVDRLPTRAARRCGDRGPHVARGGGRPRVGRHARHLGLPRRRLMGQGDLTAASEALERSGLGGQIGDYGAWSFFLHSRGRLRLAAGDVRSAIADLRACGTRMGQWGANNPSVIPWRSSLAEALDAAGEREDALQLTTDEVTAARRVGLQCALGIALSAEGRLTPGERGIRLLNEAVAVLEATPARLELARAM